ncbi:MAG: cation transporter [bacterium]|nr:cation transporter [bacterium]
MTDANHDHDHVATSGARMLATVLLNFAITIAELAGGALSGSLSLISDAFHNFSDGIAIIVSYSALRLSRRNPNHQFTFGYKRAQVLAAVINAGVLLAICVYLVRESVVKLIHPQVIDGGLMLAVATIGLLANIVGTLLLRSGAKSNLNIRSAYLHLLSDAISSVAVILGAIVIKLTGQSWVDAVLSLGIAVYVGWESWKIIRLSVDILMLKVPTTVVISDLEAALTTVPGVADVHHIHLWQVDDRDVHFEAHVVTTGVTVNATAPQAKEIARILRDRFAVNHVTLQFEAGPCLTGKDLL